MSDLKEILLICSAFAYATAALGFLWRRAKYEQRLASSIAGFKLKFESVGNEFMALRHETNQHTELLARVVQQLDDVESRVSRVERHLDRQ